jgi:hypothetical protein
MDGELDETRIYDYVLSDEQIAEIAASRSTSQSRSTWFGSTVTASRQYGLTVRLACGVEGAGSPMSLVGGTSAVRL